MTTLDSRTVTDPTIPGLSYRVDILADDDSAPDDADCYDDADKAAWRADDWRYVGVRVTPVLDDLGELPDLADALWSVEWGTMPQVTIDTTQLVEKYPVPDLVTVVRANLLSTVDARETTPTAR